MHDGVCIDSLYYMAMRGTFEGDGMFFAPSPSELWIACLVIAGHVGTEEKSVSMMDFSLGGGNGRKDAQDVTAHASLNADWMFPTATLRQDQAVDGVIAFSVPKSSKLPYVLEIDLLLDFSLAGGDVDHVAIPKLVSLESLMGI